MPNTGEATFLNILKPLWVRAAPAGPSSTVHYPCRTACRCSSPQSTSRSICCSAPMTIGARQIAASRRAGENPSTCSAARNFPLGLGPSCRPNVGRPQSRNFIGTGDVARRVEDPSFGDRSHLVLLPARHNIRLAISGAWSRARIEATSRLPEPVCNPMELVPGSLEIIEKTPGAPGPAAVTQGADRGVARLCHRL